MYTHITYVYVYICMCVYIILISNVILAPSIKFLYKAFHIGMIIYKLRKMDNKKGNKMTKLSLYRL